MENLPSTSNINAKNMVTSGKIPVVLLRQCALLFSCVICYIQIRSSLDQGNTLSPEQHDMPISRYTNKLMSSSVRRLLRGNDVNHDIIANSESMVIEKGESIPLRMLLGIFTTDSKKDFHRRNLIRKTYLSYYNQINDANIMDEKQKNRICSLADLTEGNVTNPEDCQLVYTFVVGGLDPSSDPQALTELLTDNPDIPMTLTRPHVERDVTYLNIRENMNTGKTPTWFKYASSRIPENLNINLIAKVDTDTIVFPRSLLNELENELGTEENPLNNSPTLVYGGHKITPQHNYMQGGFYFLSKNLAQYITSDLCPRDEIVEDQIQLVHHRAEDREVGAFVKKRERSPDSPRIHRVHLPQGTGSTHYKRLKDPEGFRVRWKAHFAEEAARLKYESLPIPPKADRGAEVVCPRPETIREAFTAFDNGVNMNLAKKTFLKYVKGCRGAES